MEKTVQATKSQWKSLKDMKQSTIKRNTEHVMWSIKPLMMNRFRLDSNVLVEQLSNKNIRKKI